MTDVGQLDKMMSPAVAKFTSLTPAPAAVVLPDNKSGNSMVYCACYIYVYIHVHYSIGIRYESYSVERLPFVCSIVVGVHVQDVGSASSMSVKISSASSGGPANQISMLSSDDANISPAGLIM